MKTKNNVQKTRLTTTAAAVLIVLGLTVNAQEVMNSLFENNETNQIAMLTGKAKSNSFASTAITGNFINTNSFSIYLAKESENPLVTENWMFEENIFIIPTETEVNTESTTEKAGRMATENTFSLNSRNELVKTEEQLNLENWMLDENIFNLNQSNFKSNVQKMNYVNSEITTSELTKIGTDEIVIEEWMKNPENWKK